MCIICYKPGGANLPSKKQFKTMFRRNPDGCGYMFTRPGAEAVTIKKGFMSYSDFRQSLAADKLTAADTIVFHFRIATHGGINPEMTQPFPLSAKKRQLTSLQAAAPVGVAHNGIIDLCGDARKLSDTAKFIRDYMTRLITDTSKPIDDITLNIIEACVVGSRMAILTAAGRVYLLGRGWTKDGGLYFSNTSYIDYFSKPVKKKSRKSSLYSWDDDLYQDADIYNYCNGYCSECQFLSQCWDTSAATDAGINSI